MTDSWRFWEILRCFWLEKKCKNLRKLTRELAIYKD
jgi:hypothetical protein